jgi:hypothetical protein
LGQGHFAADCSWPRHPYWYKQKLRMSTLLCCFLLTVTKSSTVDWCMT